MLVLLIFEPFIIHSCPQITAVALTILALSLFLAWLYDEDNRRPYLLMSIGVSTVTYHAIMPIALVTSVVSVSVIVVPAFHEVLRMFDSLRVMRVRAKHDGAIVFIVVMILIVATGLYNTYVAPSVVERMITTPSMSLRGEAPRLDAYSLVIEDPWLSWQYNVLVIINRVAVLLPLGILSAVVALYLLVKCLRAG